MVRPSAMRHWRFVLSSVAVIGRVPPGPVSAISLAVNPNALSTMAPTGWRTLTVISATPVNDSLAGSRSSASRYSDGTTSFGSWPGVASNVKRGCAAASAAKNIAATTRKVLQGRLDCMFASRFVP